MGHEPLLRYAVLPVGDVTTSLHFYRTLGCELAGRDGDAWAGVRSQHVALSLCGPTDARRPSLPALAVTTTDPARLGLRLSDAGGAVLASRDGHMLIADPDGHLVMLSQRRQPV